VKILAVLAGSGTLGVLAASAASEALVVSEVLVVSGVFADPAAMAATAGPGATAAWEDEAGRRAREI
jgi:hypothetical protein